MCLLFTIANLTANPLQVLHDARLVHRDVKPSNILYCENLRQFKLIDLGACADLRTGTNYNPAGGFVDMSYCAPEMVRLLVVDIGIVMGAKVFSVRSS